MTIVRRHARAFQLLDERLQVELLARLQEPRVRLLRRCSRRSADLACLRGPGGRRGRHGLKRLGRRERALHGHGAACTHRRGRHLSGRHHARVRRHARALLRLHPLCLHLGGCRIRARLRRHGPALRRTGRRRGQTSTPGLWLRHGRVLRPDVHLVELRTGSAASGILRRYRLHRVEGRGLADLE